MHRRVIHAGFAGIGAAVLAAGLMLSACGPIEYIATVPLDAAGAYGEAKHVNAEKHAPFEMTAAREYLHKARELAGYARFHSSVQFGQKAADYAKKAQKIAAEKASLPDAHENLPEGGGTGVIISPQPAAEPASTGGSTSGGPTRVIIIPQQQPENQ